MNTSIMEEWLEWFDRQMDGPKVLLLLDNFSAHECALDSLEQKDVCVEFLPPDTTSLCQPCDQGIIYALKGHYRRHFTQWCFDQWDEEKDPFAEINLLMAIRLIINAWEEDVKGKTLVNCFRKSNVLPVQGESTGGDDEEEEENEEEEEEEGHDDGDKLAKLRAELEQTMSQILAQHRVVQVLALDDFVMPVDEEVDDPDVDLNSAYCRYN
jgi:hypothetical protein